MVCWFCEKREGAWLYRDLCYECWVEWIREGYTFEWWLQEQVRRGKS
jgi:hypothetical protein